MTDEPDLVSLSRWLVAQPTAAVAIRSGATVNAEDFISQVQAWVTTLNQQAGDRWAVYHGDSCEFLAILLALWQLGRTAWVANDNKPGTVVRLAAQVDGFCGEFPGATNVITKPVSEAPQFRGWIVPEPDLIAVVLFTSGSTGDPKLINKTIQQLESEIEVLETLWPSDPDSAVLATVSHHHFYGMIFALLWPFSSGRRFESRFCELSEDILFRATQHRRFVLISSPSHLGRFNPKLGWKSVVSRCDYVVSSAAPLAREDSIKVGRLLESQVREIYGSTETGAVAWRSQQIDQVDARWQALPGVELAADDNGLKVRSSYLGETGNLVLPDKVRFDDPDNFRLLGRMDRIAKVEGKRISLASIERLLQNHAWVSNVRALIVQRARIETAIVMQLTKSGRAQLDASGRKAIISIFRGLLSQDFEAVVLPRRWRFVEQMPFDQQGKLPLANLQALFDKKDVMLPQVIDRQLVDGQLILHCEIPAGLIYFDGHMENCPVLPGIVQVHWAVHFARQMLSVSGRFERLEAIKFHQIVLPRYQVTIDLGYNEKSGKLSFSYKSERGHHSSGRICFSQ